MIEALVRRYSAQPRALIAPVKTVERGIGGQESFLGQILGGKVVVRQSVAYAEDELAVAVHELF